MAMSGSGLQGQIKAKVAGYITPTHFTIGGSDETIGAIADAVVDEVTVNGKVDVACSCNGTCGNTLTSPGPYAGTGNATSAGSLYNLDATRLQGSIKSSVEAALSGVDWTEGSSDETSGALARAIVDHIHSQARCSVNTTDSGTCPAGGGPVSGSGVGNGSIDSLDGAALHAAFKSEIASAVPGTDFTKGNADKSLQALAEAIVEHIHSSAEAAVETDLSTLTAPPPGGPASGTAADADASIS